MHEQNWQEPLKFDWAGENGPPLLEEDFRDCVIRRILQGDFHPPWERIEYVRSPPEDSLTFRRNQRLKTYIPGKQKTPQYPRLSALTKQEHLSGLKVLSTEYKVQPSDYPNPTSNDFETFARIREIYEKEQIVYRLWANKRWVKGDCIRTLHPKPLLETVYDAQFELKKNEVHSLPISYRMSAQVSLETGMNAFDILPIKDLKSVDVSTLPNIEFPDLLDQDLSILKPYELPKPCRRHPSRFILPDESTVSELPLPEVHRQLAQFAMENGAAFIASEKALECLFDADRNWKLAVSVVKVICPESGVVKKVLVLGDEVSVKKECGAQRTHIAYKHLLRHTFLKSSKISESDLPTHQQATMKDPDQFHSREANASCSNYEKYLQIDVTEQRRQSIESAHESCDDVKNNSNATSDADIPSCSSEPNQLTEAKQVGTTTESQPAVSVPDGGDVNPVMVFGSTCSLQNKWGTIKSYKHLLGNTFTQSNETSATEFPTHPTHQATSRHPDRFHTNEAHQNDSIDEEELKIDIIEQRRRSTEGNSYAYDDTDDSNAPNNAEPSGCGSEPNELMDGDEQRRRSTEGHSASYDDTNDSNAPINAELSSSDSEPDRLIIGEGDQQSSKDIELKTTVSVPIRQDNYQNQAELYRIQNFSQPFGTDSDEDPSLEEGFPIRTRAEKEAAVPHEKPKQINFAAMYTEIDEATTSDKISFDTNTLHEAINDIIEDNPSSREDIDDINCTCKGTKFEVPPPRSFKKWHVKKMVSNRGFDLIIHSSHKLRERQREVILEPIVEWQPELGACKQSAGRLRGLALAFMMRPMAKLINVRLDYKNGNIIVIDKLDERKFMSWHGDKRSEIAAITYAVIDQLRYLKEGQYILEHDSNHGKNAMLYSAVAAAEVAGSSDHTLSLRPERDHLTETEEAILSKIPPELSRALLPYHKGQGILPLAFTTDKNHVRESKRVIRPLAQPRIPPQAFQGKEE